MSSSIHVDLTNIIDLLHCWLSRYVASEGLTWLSQKQEQIATGTTARVLFSAFGAVPGYTGKKDLELTQEDLQAAETIRKGWSPADWSVDQAGRTLLLLTLPHNEPEKYLASLEKLFAAADVGELVALYQSLPILPYPEQYIALAKSAIRSNMTAVFNAVALHNPYPTDYFNEHIWNQMILKAVFVGSPLHLIWGLDRRANPELARMLVDYAHERWAAKRTVTPELWRLVAPFADAEMIADLEKVLNDVDATQQQAAALACSQSPSPDVQALLQSHSDLQLLIQEGSLTWNSFNKEQLSN